MPTSRSGRRYAQGSHASRDGYAGVKVCATCGGRLVLSAGRALQFETTLGPHARVRGWHADCGRPS